MAVSRGRVELSRKQENLADGEGRGTGRLVLVLKSMSKRASEKRNFDDQIRSPRPELLPDKKDLLPRLDRRRRLADCPARHRAPEIPALLP
jgi:hypothetical protein